MPARLAIATPFHWPWPWCASSYPASRNAAAGAAASVSLVSCISSTSGPGALEPPEHLLQAGLEGVHVPGGDSHPGRKLALVSIARHNTPHALHPRRFPHLPARRAHARQAGRVPPRRGRLPVRAQVGRLPRDRVSRRRRRPLHPEPRLSGRSTAISRSCTRRCSTELPEGCVVDGEIVIATPHGLDFDALQLRLHPAASRVAKLAEGDAGLVRRLRSARRRRPRPDGGAAARAPGARSSGSCADVGPPVYLTPMTRDRDTAARWLEQFEGAGLDGVIAKPAGQSLPARQARDDQGEARAHRRLRGRRVPLAQERARTRWARCSSGSTTTRGVLQHVGRDLVVHHGDAQAAGARSWRRCGRTRWRTIPGGSGPRRTRRERSRMPGAQSRWSAGKDLSWEPLRIERVCEVKYDHLQGDRFRHAAVFLRWRPDKQPERLPLRPARGHPALRAGEGLLVRVERLLSRPELGRHVLQVHPDAGPGG